MSVSELPMLSEDKEGAGMYARRSTAHLADREGVESGEWGLSVVGSDLRVALSSFWRGVLWGKCPGPQRLPHLVGDE